MRDPFPASLERIPGVPIASQEEALSTGKARGIPGSCHHFNSPTDVSVNSRGNCFPCTASTFTPRIDSHHGGTWDSPVGKPGGKASRESHGSLDQRHGNRDTAATDREESARASPLETMTDSPGETPEVPQDPCQHWRGILRFDTNSTQDPRRRHRRERNPERPPSNSLGDWPFLRPPERVPEVPVVS